MQADVSRVRDEIDVLLRSNGGYVMNVIRHYMRNGHRVFVILRDDLPYLVTLFHEGRSFIGRYPHTADEDIDVFIGQTDPSHIYYQFVRRV